MPFSTLRLGNGFRSLDLLRVLDFREAKSDAIPSKSVFDRIQAVPEPDVYQDDPKTYILEARLTTLERSTLYSIDADKLQVLLSDSGAPIAYLWLEKIGIKYLGVEHLDAPWRVTVNLVQVAGADEQMLEGDYLSWAVYDSFDDTDVAGAVASDWAIGNEAETIVVLVMASSNKIKRYNISSKVVTDLGLTDPIEPLGSDPMMYATSSYRTYYAVIDNYTHLRIIKNGVIIQSFTEAQLQFNASQIFNVSVSPTGKHIIVFGERTSGNTGVTVLVGS